MTGLVGTGAVFPVAGLVKDRTKIQIPVNHGWTQMGKGGTAGSHRDAEAWRWRELRGLKNLVPDAVNHGSLRSV